MDVARIKKTTAAEAVFKFVARAQSKKRPVGISGFRPYLTWKKRAL